MRKPPAINLPSKSPPRPLNFPAIDIATLPQRLRGRRLRRGFTIVADCGPRPGARASTLTRQGEDGSARGRGPRFLAVRFIAFRAVPMIGRFVSAADLGRSGRIGRGDQGRDVRLWPFPLQLDAGPGLIAGGIPS